VSVRTVPAWGERKAAGGATSRATPVRPVQVWTDNTLGFVLVQMLSLVLEVVVLVVGLGSLQVVSLLAFSPSCSIRSMVFLSWFWTSSS
jgi:hypothetical protein